MSGEDPFDVVLLALAPVFLKIRKFINLSAFSTIPPRRTALALKHLEVGAAYFGKEKNKRKKKRKEAEQN
jgi:hypothetical protein